MASIEASVTIPQGAPVEATAEAVAKLEDLARAEHHDRSPTVAVSFMQSAGRRHELPAFRCRER